MKSFARLSLAKIKLFFFIKKTDNKFDYTIVCLLSLQFKYIVYEIMFKECRLSNLYKYNQLGNFEEIFMKTDNVSQITIPFER